MWCPFIISPPYGKINQNRPSVIIFVKRYPRARAAFVQHDEQDALHK